MNSEKTPQERVRSIVRENVPKSNILVAKTLIVIALICFCAWACSRSDL